MPNSPSNGFNVVFWFDQSPDRVAASAQVAPGALELRSGPTSHASIRFVHWSGPSFIKPIVTWLRLSTGCAVPVSGAELSWLSVGASGPILRIAPCWPADFRIMIQCCRESEREDFKRAVVGALAADPAAA